MGKFMEHEKEVNQMENALWNIEDLLKMSQRMGYDCIERFRNVRDLKGCTKEHYEFWLKKYEEGLKTAAQIIREHQKWLETAAETLKDYKERGLMD